VITMTKDDWAWTGTTHRAAMHPIVFPGISLGPLDVPVAAIGEVVPTDVVVIGRFDDPRSVDPRHDARHPGSTFVIERLVWADGAWQDRRSARLTSWATSDIDAASASGIATTVLPGPSVILSQATVRATVLSALDPIADAATRRATDPHERVWYVRAMTRSDRPAASLAEPGTSRRLGWVVIAADGTVLASHVPE
jgi:hypothetical protein